MNTQTSADAFVALTSIDESENTFLRVWNPFKTFRNYFFSFVLKEYNSMFSKQLYKKIFWSLLNYMNMFDENTSVQFTGT